MNECTYESGSIVVIGKVHFKAETLIACRINVAMLSKRKRYRVDEGEEKEMVKGVRH